MVSLTAAIVDYAPVVESDIRPGVEVAVLAGVVSCLPVQAHTLPDATPPLGNIQLFSKMALTFKPMMQYLYPLRFRMP